MDRDVPSHLKAIQMTKLDLLISDEGFDTLDEFLEAWALDSVCIGICMNPGCDYTAEVEPDQEKGWCELCETNTVQSGLVLAGVI